MTRPIYFTRCALVGDKYATRTSVVDLDALVYDYQLDWPEKEIDVTGYEWKAWTWLGWSLVLMWKDQEA